MTVTCQCYYSSCIFYELVFIHHKCLWFFFLVQKFLLLDELVRTNTPLSQEEKKEASVEIQDLICYWDKVSSVYINI